MPLKTAANSVHDVTQPLVLGIGGAVICGVSVDDVIKIGTLLLMLLNIPLAGIRIWKAIKEKDGD